jgi:glutamate racemase
MMTKPAMKIGVFDSGIGGLMIAGSIMNAMPDLDIVYCGDTLHLPYGSRSTEAITEYTRRGIEFLFKQNCQIVIVACNTASAAALRSIQQNYLPSSPYVNRRVLGVVVPTLEAAIDHGYKRLGLIATNYIVRTGIYREELQKINPSIEIVQQATPLLVPLIENEGMAWVDDVLNTYLSPMVEQGVDSLLLGCTHYVYLKSRVQSIVGDDVKILSQDDVIPAKLSDYLRRHSEHNDKVGRSGQRDFFLTDITDTYTRASAELFQKTINFKNALDHGYDARISS